MEVRACLSSVTGHRPSGESAAADGSTDPSKLEVSLTLTNKFEGLGTDAGDTSARSLLLRWVAAALAPADLGPVEWPRSQVATPFSLGHPVLRKVPPCCHPCWSPPGHLGV